MKTNGWLVLGVMLSTSVFAQQMTTPPPAGPAAKPAPPVIQPVAAPSAEVAPAPVEKTRPTKKKALAEKKIAFVEKTVSLTPGPATIVGNNVNVRGQATLNSEVVTRLNDGEAVTVLEQITLDKHKADEPAQWAKIVMPESGRVWVHANFIDPTNMTVLPNKLNMRGGPGENYSVVGVLERGTTVREILTEGNWMRIGVPQEAYAFVAAIYLNQETPVVAAPTPAPTPVETQTVSVPAPGPTELAPLPTTTTVAAAPSVAPAPTEAPAAAPIATPVPTPPIVTPAPEPAPVVAPPVAEEPLPKRIVQHEGIVKGTWSIQAPTRFALVNPDTGKTINYLYTSSTNLDLRRYKGLRIVVTGEEGLDERWKNTPVITIQRIQVVE